MRKPKKPKMPKVNTSDCAKGRMHQPAAQRYLKTMPGGLDAVTNYPQLISLYGLQPESYAELARERI